MVTARGRRELARTASWISVRSGLGWLIGVWVVLTLGSAGVQLQSMQLAAGVAAKDPGALVVMTLVSVGFQGFYAVSVSYTHLRAHETVLDLVCRLLLEKKKKRLSV